MIVRLKITRHQRYKTNEPSTVPVVKALTISLGETSKQVPPSVTDGVEKARQTVTHKKQQPFVLGVARVMGKQSIYTWIN